MNISRRLFIYIILMVLGFAGLLLVSNSLLLRPLYYLNLKNTMLRGIEDPGRYRLFTGYGSLAGRT